MSGLRTGVLIAVALGVGVVLGRIEAAFALSVGLLFISIADPADARGVRLRTMLWATLWIGTGVLLGGLVSEFRVMHVGVALVMAAACGYAGALGPRGGLIGVLTLVLFAFYAGGPVVVDLAVLDTAYFVVGGLVTIAVNLLLTPPRRLGATRSGIAHAYRELQEAAQRRGVELAAPTVAAAVMSARTVMDHEGCAGASAEWANRLLASAERTRLALLALISERHLDPAYVDDFTAELGATSGAIAAEVGSPLGLPGTRRRGRSRERLLALRDIGSRAPDPRLAALADDAVEAIASAVDTLAEPWPLGSRAEIVAPPRAHVSVKERLAAHLHLSDAVVEHAIRLTIAFGGATIAAVIIDVSHSYWLPLTVAWIAKPDLANTVSRVTMRIAGTLVGLILVSVVVLVLRDVPGEDLILCVVVGLTGALALAYLNANYPLAVIGITGFVLFAEIVVGDDERYDIVARIVATTLAGLWVLLVASVRPRRTGATARVAMHATTDALRDYAGIVRAHGDSTQARARVLRERTAALAAVSAAAMETPGLWERAGDRVDPEQAAAVVSDIIGATSSILAEELLEERGQSDPALWERIDAELDDLDVRIDAVRRDATSA